MNLGAHPVPEELERIYARRFEGAGAYRNHVWQILIRDFFAQYIPQTGSVMDLGCGYGQFINNAVCRKKWGMDLNPGTKQWLSPEVTFLQQDCSAPWQLEGECLDVVFTSNFLEHLPSKEMLSATLAQAGRCLKPQGRLIAMGPNIRFTGGAYWDFFDHHVPLSEASLQEILEIRGFKVSRVIDRFLPYTMVGKREYPALFIRAYLKIPLAWKWLGKQFLIVAQKP